MEWQGLAGKILTSLRLFSTICRWSWVFVAKEASDEVLTTAETCRYLKVAPRTLYRYIKQKRVPAFKLGKDWRFVKSELELWVRKQSRAQSRSGRDQ
jgi:excisionase family DNA binding protein